MSCFFISKLQESSRPYCTLCEYAIGEMDKLITDKKNMYQVKAALDRICYELSSPIQKQCLKMVDEYTDEIIQMFVNEVKFLLNSIFDLFLLYKKSFRIVNTSRWVQLFITCHQPILNYESKYFIFFKGHILWGGHKILRNLHLRFDRYYTHHYTEQIYDGDFAKFRGLLKIYEL